MQITGDEQLDLLEELARALTPSEQRQPGDVDKHMLSERTGLPVETCKRKLEGMVREGKLIRLQVLEDKHWRTVYRRPPVAPPPPR